MKPNRPLTLALAIVLASAASLLTSCESEPDPYVQTGRIGGAAVGAVGGAIIGNNIKGGNSWGGALIGGALGGLAGDQIGKTNSMYARSR